MLSFDEWVLLARLIFICFVSLHAFLSIRLEIVHTYIYIKLYLNSNFAGAKIS